MEDNNTKQILINVQLKADQLKSDVVSLNGALDTLLTQQLRLKGAGQQNTEQFVALASQIRNTKTDIRNANKELDNTTKALNAESNSISQNRALLSLLTAEYIKLGQAGGKTAASTQALGKQIDQLSTKLKAQEEAIGQNQRKVGSYSQAIKGAMGLLGQVSPKVSGFAAALNQAANSFNIMGKASKDSSKSVGEAVAETEGAEVATTGLSSTLIGAAAAIVGVIVVIGAYIAALAKLTPNAQAIQRTFSGVGNVWRQMVSDFQEEKLDDNFDQFKQKWADFFSRMKGAYVDGKNLQGQFQDLARSAAVLDVSAARADATIADLQLKMRNRRNTPAQEQEYYNKIASIIQTSYNQRKEVANKEYELAVRAAVEGRNFTDKEIAMLKEKGVAYATYLDKIKGLANKEGAGSDIAAISKAQEAQIAAERFLQTKDDKAQNFLDSKQMRAEAAQNADLQKQEDIKRKIAEINSERIASITKMMEYEQEAFGKEISSSDEHYRQLIFKEQGYIAEAEKIKRNKKSSSKTKALADEQISAAHKNVAQIKMEQYAESERLLVEHNKSMIEIARKGALDLQALEIQGIDDSRKRELAAIQNKFESELSVITKTDSELQENIRNLTKEISDKKKLVNSGKLPKDEQRIAQNELQALQTTLNEQNALLDQNSGKFIAYEKQKDKAINDTNKKFDIQNKLIQDQTNILFAQDKKGIFGGKNNPFNKDKERGEQTLLADKENEELEKSGLEGTRNKDGSEFSVDQMTEKLNIIKSFEEKRDELTKEYAKKRQEVEMQAAESVSNAAFNIIEHGIKSAAQAREVQLSKDKERELANTSLTSAQKIAINNKYRILEGQAKVKEFKLEQKLAIAKTAIAGAEAIVKAAPDPILMGLAALTAIAEEAVILSQKPPAYATGGQFISDGKGSVLPGYSRHDNVNAQLRSGEGVVVSEAMRDPYARNLVSAVNVAFGGRDFSIPNPGKGFAIGGIVTDGNNSNRYYAQPQEGTQNLANSIAYSLINNFPPVVVDVKDVNNQQSIYARTMNRVNL